MNTAALDKTSLDKTGVPDDFNAVAKRYDFLVGMNPGYNRHLRLSAKRMQLAPSARILDLCCGTGLSTGALRKTYAQAHISGLDGSSGMLAVAREKNALAGIDFHLGNAMNPEAAGCAGPYDAIFMAYGIRNMPDADACLARLLTLLKPGGILCCHEYSVAHSALARALWNAVAYTIIIPSGWLTSPGSGIYRYLRKSVVGFDGKQALLARLARAGFTDCSEQGMDGWQYDIVHTFLARRPL